MTVTIDANTVIKLDGAVKTAADLKTGLYAMALGTGTTAVEIRAYTPKPATTQPTTPGPTQIAGGGPITAAWALPLPSPAAARIIHRHDRRQYRD